MYSQFQSTLSLRRATLGGDLHLDFAGISIHALLAESDPEMLEGCTWDGWISIHALLAESDYSMTQERMISAYFNPRSPCGERPMSSAVSPLPS